MTTTSFRALLMVGVFTAGAALGARVTPAAHADAHDAMYDNLRLFSEVLSHIENDYVEPVDEVTLIESAIRGMVAELDPHSAYMDPEQYAEMRQDTQGEYVGIGVEIRMDNDRVTFSDVYGGGPASDAGVQIGDLLHSVDGADATTWDIEATVNALRGQRGERVAIEVERTHDDGTVTIESFDLIRDRVVVDAVLESLPVPGYGLVRITSFQRNVGEELRDAIDELESMNDGELSGLVLDLRGNPGGLLSEGINVADAFLQRGTIVSTMGRWEEDNRAWNAHRGNTRYTGPLVVLVNEGTASASEIVAGALQDHDRAVVIGTQTYGKGSVQSVLDLIGGSGLKLTVSLYYTPDGRSIQNRGITPDLEVAAGTYNPAPTTLTREAELDGTLANPTDEVADPLAEVTDMQLRFALQQLRALEVLLSN